MLRYLTLIIDKKKLQLKMTKGNSSNDGSSVLCKVIDIFYLNMIIDLKIFKNE